jgi:hypothetical protein
MSPSLLPEGFARGHQILLLAGSVSRIEDTRTLLAREEAILSLVEAVLASGARIAVPADPDLALLVATAALSYSALPSAEPGLVAEPAGISIYETQGENTGLRRMLVPLGRLNALRYYDEAGESVRLDQYEMLHAVDDAPRETWIPQRLTNGLLERVNPLAAVVVAPDAAIVEEIGLVSRRNFPFAVLPGTGDDLIGQRYSEGNAFNRLAGFIRDEPTTPFPWPALLQELVTGWLSGNRQDQRM